MADYHRGRSRSGYYDDDYHYEERPRHRSLGRVAFDKLEYAIGALTLDRARSKSKSNTKNTIVYDDDHHHRHRPSSPHRHHTRDSHWDRDSTRHRSYHSTPPSRHRSRSHGRHHDHDRRNPSRADHTSWTRGFAAGANAALVEAVRLRKEPGPWTGKKGQRIATAAISAGAIGAAADHHKQHHHSGRDGNGEKGVLGSTLGGLVVNRLVNGPRREVRR